MENVMAWWKNQNLIIKLLTFFVILGITCCICSVPVAIITPDRTLTPRTITQTEAEATPETNTSLDLGEIPIPTSQPTSIPVSESEIPLEVHLYALELGEKSQIMADALQELSQLLQDPKPGNDAWTVRTAVQVTLIQLTHNELTAMEVPAEMTEIHAAVLDATGDCNTSMDYLVSGIDNLSIEAAETASAYMIQCSEKLPRVAELMEEYVAQHK